MPKGWTRLRAAALRAEPLCRPCAAAGRVAAAAEVDHIVPRSSGGTSDPANLQAICRTCHRQKTAAEALAGRERGGP